MTEQLFEHEINNIPQSLCEDGKMASSYIMAQMLKLVNDLIHQLLWCYHMTKKVNLQS